MALQEAQRRLLTEREEERKRLARELHDDVIQDLLSVNYELGDITEDATTGATLKADLGDISESIRELVVDLRRICGDLRPPTIDSLGMVAALQSYSQLWSERTASRSPSTRHPTSAPARGHRALGLPHHPGGTQEHPQARSERVPSRSDFATRHRAG